MVNLDKEFKNLQLKDKIVSHYFQPKIIMQNLPRHKYYADLKDEFITDIKTYGFSPYITQTVDFQKKDPNLKKFSIKKHHTNEYFNYIKKSSQTKSNKMELILREKSKLGFDIFK